MEYVMKLKYFLFTKEITRLSMVYMHIYPCLGLVYIYEDVYIHV